MKTRAVRSDGAQDRKMGAVFTALMALAVGGAAQPTMADLRAPGIKVVEGRTAQFAITFSPPWGYNFAIRWSYETQDGTATSGEDYVAASGHVVFPAGATSATVSVATKEDSVADDEETFSLKLHTLETKGAQRGSNEWTSIWGVRGLPSQKTIHAEIVDRTYEDEKYGVGYTGMTFGE